MDLALNGTWAKCVLCIMIDIDGVQFLCSVLQYIYVKMRIDWGMFWS